MTAKLRKNERILNLLAYLMKSDRVVPFDEIRNQVDGYNKVDACDKSVLRNFERDKKALRETGIQVDYSYDVVRGVWGYVVIRPEGAGAGVHLDEREVNLLMRIASTAGRGAGAVAQDLASACQKLLAANPLSAMPATDSELDVAEALAGESGQYAENLQVATLAVEEHKRIVFTYTTYSSDEESRRLVEPYGLMPWQGEICLAGRCVATDTVLVFRIDRVRGDVRLADGDEASEFQVPADFDISGYVGRSMWEKSNNEPVEVTVKLDELAAWFAEALPARAMVLKKNPDGTAFARLRVRNRWNFYRWLLTWHTHAKIIDSGEVAEGFLEFLAKVHSTWPR